jgi:hypothetical protein
MENAEMYLQKISDLNNFLDQFNEEVELFVNNTFLKSSDFSDLLTDKRIIITMDNKDYLGKYRGQNVYLLDADSGKPEMFIVPLKYKDQFRRG